MRVVLLISCLTIGAGGATAPPALRLIDPSPLTVRGVRFEPGERVRVTVSGDVAGSRVLRATSRGIFIARFRLATGRCTYVVVRASGLRGSRAKLELLPVCDPAP